MIKILDTPVVQVLTLATKLGAVEEELSNRGYDVRCDAVMVKDVNEDLISGYDIFYSNSLQLI